MADTQTGLPAFIKRLPPGGQRRELEALYGRLVRWDTKKGKLVQTDYWKTDPTANIVLGSMYMAWVKNYISTTVAPGFSEDTQWALALGRYNKGKIIDAAVSACLQSEKSACRKMEKSQVQWDQIAKPEYLLTSSKLLFGQTTGTDFANEVSVYVPDILGNAANIRQLMTTRADEFTNTQGRYSKKVITASDIEKFIFPYMTPVPQRAKK